MAPTTNADVHALRVASGDWTTITEELNDYGGALLPQLLTREETEQIRDLYDRDVLFRSTVNMGRHRFGEGEYRYFNAPYPKPTERLKHALYPRLLPIARDWWGNSGARRSGRTPCRHGSICASRPAKLNRPRSC